MVLRVPPRPALARSLALAAGLVLVALAGAGPAARLVTAEEDAHAAAIEGYVRAAMEASAIPGLAVAIVEDGRVVHAAAYGVAGPDGRPMTTSTRVVIGSVGKSITALAVRQLVEAGRVALDAPLRRYLPWFSLAASPDALEALTIRSLLEHTSGLSTADGQDPRWYAPSLTPEAVARGIKSVRPGTGGTYEYSNLNYVLLGVVVEAASGHTYADYVAENVFGPLAMRSSTAGPEPPAGSDVATGHRYLFGLPVPWDEPLPGGIVPAGYQVSTAEDMAHFVAALASGGSWAGTDVVSGAPAPSRAPALGTDWLPLGTGDPGVSVGQSGSTLTSNAHILVMPARRLGVVVVVNANPTQLLGLPRGAADIALGILRLSEGGAPPPSTPTVQAAYLVVDAVLAALAGLLLLHAWRARTWPARLARTRHRRWLIARTVAADLIVPLAVLVGVPLAIGATGSTRAGDLVGGWRFLLWTLPDLGLALLVLALVPLGIGAWKLMAARRSALVPAPAGGGAA